jgi:hypothetical protein
MPFFGSLKGRCGDISYEDGARRLQIYWELGTKGLIIGTVPFCWANRADPPLTDEQQLHILAELRLWLQGQNVSSDLDDGWPPDVPEEPLSKCIWTSCGNPRAQGYYICKDHWMRAFIEARLEHPPNNRWSRP